MRRAIRRYIAEAGLTIVMFLLIVLSIIEIILRKIELKILDRQKVQTTKDIEAFLDEIQKAILIEDEASSQIHIGPPYDIDGNSRN